MLNIMFVCHGNICRSPMAEFMLKHMTKNLNTEFHIESCATSYEEIGNDIHYGTKYILDKYNIPYQKRRARRFEKSDYDKFDYIFVMDDNNLRNLNNIAYDKNNKYKKLRCYIDNRNISDPWYTNNFELTYKDILEGLNAFLNELNLG